MASNIPTLDEPLDALMSETWNEPFEFYQGNEHCPNPLAAGSTVQIIMLKREIGADEIILSTAAGTCFIDSHRIVPNWSVAAIDAAITPGLYDFSIKETRLDGVIDVRLIGVINWIAGL